MKNMFGLIETARVIEKRTGRNCTRDQLYMYITRSGCPDASARVSGRRAFTEDDIESIVRWFQATGRYVRQAVGA